MPRKKDNPDIRTSSSSWSPSRVYTYLCRCFRRKPGALGLSKEEFVASRKEYLNRALPAFFQWKGQPFKKGRQTTQRRRYSKKKRKGVLDSDEKLRAARRRIHMAEFEWIILQGEFKGLKKSMPAEQERLTELKRKYSYLPRVADVDIDETVLRDSAETLGIRGAKSGLLGDLEDNPFKLAIVEVAFEMEINPDSLERMLKPSYRLRAGVPAWLAEMSRPSSKKSAQEARRISRLAWAGFKGKI